MAVKKLRKIQIGIETAAGTNIAASTVWRGTGVPEDVSTFEFVEEDVGYLPGTDRLINPKVMAKIELEPTPATFEQLPLILTAGVKTVKTGVTDTGGAGKIYAYVFPTTAANTIDTLTVEGGDDQQEEESAYCFVESFRLGGRAGEAVQMSATLIGQQFSTGAFTASTTAPLPAVECMMFSKGKLYLDAVTGSVGGTVKSNTLLEGQLDVKTGWQPVFTASGNLYFSFAKSTPPDVTLALTFEHDATAVAEKVNWRAGTPRLVRLQFLGSTFASSGAYPVHTVNIDLAGKWASFDKIGEQDGNDIVRGVFQARYNTTASLFATITVVNDAATLPASG